MDFMAVAFVYAMILGYLFELYYDWLEPHLYLL